MHSQAYLFMQHKCQVYHNPQIYSAVRHYYLQPNNQPAILFDRYLDPSRGQTDYLIHLLIQNLFKDE